MLLSRPRIENCRGVKLLELALDETTVLVGEKNCGKITVLPALRACLYMPRSAGRSSPFEEFNRRFDSQSADQASAPPIIMALTFEDSTAGGGSREMQEGSRNSFVAITRTIESLALSYAQRYNGWRREPSRFLFEVGFLERDAE